MLARMGGYNEPPVFVDFLTKALEKLPTDVKVTQAESSSSELRVLADPRTDSQSTSIRRPIFGGRWAPVPASAGCARPRPGR